ncbi:amidase domain-containing protein [Inconstantimicrobium mannanitabidum]|uniref:Uncharacterized protein n=1 Tax=Inconstantimicrobium mannanitabidum TaxID=1604901 RepID=A0ACB5R9S7_9CLOT|nr:amidase domain-containing protein [Clostridium sp. TW13]GKX65716.1 hypothetical protein rsdtw13_09740 [Clostridium sp. TW13]
MNKARKLLIIMMTLIFTFPILCYGSPVKEQNSANSSEEEVVSFIEKLFIDRNKAILNQDLSIVQHIYNKKTKYGQWAYEYEEQKMKYIQNWGEKQGVKFIDITPDILIRRVKVGETSASISLSCSTAYKYVYEGEEDINCCRIGTYHIIQLIKKEGNWIITKEWYKDPFGDSLNLQKLKTDSIKEYILAQKPRDFSDLKERRKKCAQYGLDYCGAGNDEGTGFNYNKKYRNYNSEGGDCANFASQMLHEGAGFKMNSSWNVDSKGAATRSWVNADGFKDYMIYSGRASVISYGNYEKVYKASYKLLPGDFVAYEKKGDITHISMVTGADSKGYTLVTCHNTDRREVPWDLGWSNTNIKYWLVRVHH